MQNPFIYTFAIAVIIKIDCIEISEYVKADGGFLIMSNSKQIPVSTNKIQNLLEKL